MTDQLRQAAQKALEALESGLAFPTHSDVLQNLRTALEQQAEPVQEPFEDLATELFVVAQRSPADEGFSDTIDRIESWLREHFSTQPQRKPLTKGEIEIILSRHYMYMEDLIRAIEAAHGIKEGA